MRIPSRFIGDRDCVRRCPCLRAANPAGRRLGESRRRSAFAGPRRDRYGKADRQGTGRGGRLRDHLRQRPAARRQEQRHRRHQSRKDRRRYGRDQDRNRSRRSPVVRLSTLKTRSRLKFRPWWKRRSATRPRISSRPSSRPCGIRRSSSPPRPSRRPPPRLRRADPASKQSQVRGRHPSPPARPAGLFLPGAYCCLPLKSVA